jgi:hypothetical protein
VNDNTPAHLTVRRIADIPIQDTQKRWLIKDLWALEAVGIIGGAPKCCKSWLGLDLAISVASKTLKLMQSFTYRRTIPAQFLLSPVWHTFENILYRSCHEQTPGVPF